MKRRCPAGQFPGPQRSLESSSAWILSCSLVLGALFFAAPVDAVTVLAVTSDSPAQASAFIGAAETAVSGAFDPGDLVARTGTDTPALVELTPYDVVLVWSATTVWDDADALGDVLADYVDQGGSVILAAHALEQGFMPGGRFVSTPYSPVDVALPGSVPGTLDLAASDASHPVLAGIDGTSAVAVTQVTFPDRDQGNPALSSTGDVIAVDTLGNNVVAGLCDRSVIAMNLYPPDLAEPDPPTSQDANQLFVNVVQATQHRSTSVELNLVDSTVDEGSNLGLSATATSDLGPLSYSWDFDDDGVFDDASGQNVVFDTSALALSGPSTEVVAVQVTNACSQAFDASATITVDNVAPTLATISSDSPQPEGGVMTFTADGYDLGGDALVFSWDFGDDSSVVTGDPVTTTDSATHTYAADGSYTVTVTVSDGETGGVDSSTLVVQVTNDSPVIVSTTNDGPQPEGSPMTMSAVATDPGGDTVTFTWNFGDGSGAVTGDEVTHVYGAEGTFVVNITAADGEGGTTQTTMNVEVTNAAPSIVSITPDATILEGTLAGFTAVASDPGSDLLTYTWDFGDGTATSVGDSVEHTYADNGVYTLTLTVTDPSDGSDTATEEITVVNVAPVFTALVGDSNGDLGESLLFQGTAFDIAGAADELLWTWDFGDGSTPEVAYGLTSVSHIWTEVGGFVLTVTLDDEDGGTAEQTIGVQIDNPAPTASEISGDASLDEGETGSWALTATDASGGPVAVTWLWDDGTDSETGDGLLSASHAFQDNGTYEISAFVEDDFGGYVTRTFEVTVANVPPSFVQVTDTEATEGEDYVVTLESTDPAGSADSPTYAMGALPEGATFDATEGELVWVPTFEQTQAGVMTFEASVDDGDGGTDSMSWVVFATYLDTDGDGMPDSWELAAGLDPDIDDGEGDLDGDGLTNGEEWQQQSSADVSNAPSSPVLLSPVNGEWALDGTPVLILENAADPDDNVVHYELEVYDDVSLSTQLYTAVEDEDSDGTTEHTVTSTLPENSTVYWRARAVDEVTPGPWSSATPFFVDDLNEPPSIPVLLEPVDESVASNVPRFRVAPVTDPENEAVSVLIRVYDEDLGLHSSFDATLSETDDGSWEAWAQVPLLEDETYRWTAIAEDARGVASAVPAVAFFVVDATTVAPDAPSVVSPLGGAEVSSQQPVIVVESEPDPDGDDWLVYFQVDLEGDFSSTARQDLGPASPDEDGVAMAAVLEPLPENALVWARARSVDVRGAQSAWAVWSFRVNSLDEAPGPVVVVAPGEGEVVSALGTEVRWAPASDPDGDALMYEVRILTVDPLEAEGPKDDSVVVWQDDRLRIPDDSGSADGQFPVPVSLPSGALWVQARALDEAENAGPWGVANRFTVPGEVGPGVDLTWEEQPGCACSSAAQSGGGVGFESLGSGSALALALMGLGTLRRRRRYPARPAR